MSSRQKDLAELKAAVQELQRVYNNNKSLIASREAEIQANEEKIRDIYRTCGGNEKKKEKQMPQLTRHAQRVHTLNELIHQDQARQAALRPTYVEALRALREHSAAGKAAAAAAAASADVKDSNSGAGVGPCGAVACGAAVRAVSPSRASSASNPVHAMAVAAQPSAQPESPSPKRKGCLSCFIRKRDTSKTGGRKSRTRKLKTKNTYKKRGSSRK